MASDQTSTDSTGAQGLHSLAFEYNPDGQVLLDASGCVIELNRRAEEILRVDRGLVSGKPFSALTATDSQVTAALAGGIEAAVQGGSWNGTIPGTSLFATATSLPVSGGDARVLLIFRELPPSAAGPDAGVTEELRVLRTVMDTVADPVFFKDRDGRHLLQNEANRRYFGVSDDELRGKTAFDLPIHQPHAATYSAEDHAVLGHGQPLLNQEEMRQCIDGKSRWFLTSKFPVRNAQGEIFGLIGISREVTEHRQAERALAAERYLLQTILDSVHDIIFLKDRQGRYVLVNAAYRRLFNLDGESVAGRVVEDIPGARENAKRYRADDDAVLQSGVPLINREEPYVNSNGNHGWLLTSKVPLRNGAGETTGLVAICRDVTELKRVAHELEHQRQRFMDHVENAPLAVIEWTPVLRVQRWSAQSKEIFGWEAAEVVGKHYKEWPFVHPDDMEFVERSAMDLIERRVVRNISANRNLTKSGEVVYCVWHSSVLHDADGNPVSVLSLIQDNTERVLAEEAARRSQEERLAMERKMQEGQRLESLGVLAGGIAHDFNNLLAVILGNSSLAAYEIPGDSRAQEFLEEVQQASQRAAHLCKQMLAYAGKDTFAVEAIDLNTLVKDTMVLLHASVSKKAELHTELAPSLPMILADTMQLQQVLMNLVVNASEAIGDHPGRIDIRTGTVQLDSGLFDDSKSAGELPPGEYVSLVISDTGSGMEPDIQGRVFDPFFTTKFTGRGLGLAAVLGIIRSHRGAIRLRSAVGRGTTFEVFLPRHDRANDGAVLTEEHESGPGQIALVVDDEALVRRTTGRMLRRMGFEVLEAENGAEALQQMASAGNRVSLVLLDLLMPVMDGLETSSRLRELYAETRVILMSGYTEREAVAPISRGEIAGFLQKPFTPDELAGCVRLAFKGSSPA